MTEKEKMLAGLPYDCADTELMALWYKGKNMMREYNTLDYADHAGQRRILQETLGSMGERLQITAPFFVDYGAFIHFGNNCEVNMNCVFLDCNQITIGDHTIIAPGVHIYTVFHPIEAEVRHPSSPENTFSYAVGLTAPVKIGSHVWIGGGSIIMPGVSIGNNTTIGAGSLVTNDIPDNVLAFGSPCRVVRKLA